MKIGDTSTPMKFVDAPPPILDRDHKPRSEYAPLVAELKAQPGQWALVCSCETNAKAMNKAQYFRRQGLEATRRGCDVYARWNTNGQAL